MLNDEGFNKLATKLLPREGGYANDPNDPGGETKFGISKRSYPNVDIKNLTWEKAQEIYYRDFWLGSRIAELPAWICEYVFDFGINSGTQTAITYLQRQLGIADDGFIGPVTLGAIDKTVPVEQIKQFRILYITNRLLFMTKLKNWPSAGKSWAIRIARLLIEAA